jgi:hypothetical protein
MARDQKKLDKEDADKDRKQGVRINKLKKEVAKEEDDKGSREMDEGYRKFMESSENDSMEPGEKEAIISPDYKKGGSVKSKSKSASSRGDGIAQRGKTRA